MYIPYTESLHEVEDISVLRSIKTFRCKLCTNYLGVDVEQNILGGATIQICCDYSGVLSWSLFLSSDKKIVCRHFKS